jgi:hypothetical protein
MRAAAAFHRSVSEGVAAASLRFATADHEEDGSRRRQVDQAGPARGVRPSASSTVPRLNHASAMSGARATARSVATSARSHRSGSRSRPAAQISAAARSFQAAASRTRTRSNDRTACSQRPASICAEPEARRPSSVPSFPTRVSDSSARTSLRRRVPGSHPTARTIRDRMPRRLSVSRAGTAAGSPAASSARISVTLRDLAATTAMTRRRNATTATAAAMNLQAEGRKRGIPQG